MKGEAFKEANRALRAGGLLGPQGGLESSQGDAGDQSQQPEPKEEIVAPAPKEPPQPPDLGVDPVREALSRVGVVEAALFSLAGQAMTRVLGAAWKELEATGEPGRFCNTVKRLEWMAKLVRRARYLEPYLETNGDPGLARLRGYLQPGALEAQEARDGFEQLVRLLWSQHLRDTVGEVPENLR